MTESYVSDDLAFAALPLDVQELVARVYGGSPDAIRDQVREAERRADEAEQYECGGACEEAKELEDKLEQIRRLADS